MKTTQLLSAILAMSALGNCAAVPRASINKLDPRDAVHATREASRLDQRFADDLEHANEDAKLEKRVVAIRGVDEGEKLAARDDPPYYSAPRESLDHVEGERKLAVRDDPPYYSAPRESLDHVEGERKLAVRDDPPYYSAPRESLDHVEGERKLAVRDDPPYYSAPRESLEHVEGERKLAARDLPHSYE